MGDSRMVGFAQEEPLEMGAIIFAIHGNLPCIAADGERVFSNLVMVRQHGYDIRELLDFMFREDSEPTPKPNKQRGRKKR